jgi:hypothetical protein
MRLPARLNAGRTGFGALAVTVGRISDFGLRPFDKLTVN